MHTAGLIAVCLFAIGANSPAAQTASAPTSRPTGRLVFREGRPVILLGDRVLSQAMYCDPRVTRPNQRMTEPGPWLQRHRRFTESGVHTYTIQPIHSVDDPRWENPRIWKRYTKSRFWTADGVYPDCTPDHERFTIGKQARTLVQMDPKATFFIRFGDFVPPAWFQANPDHMQAASSGKTYRQPSLASDKGLKDLCTFIRRLITYCEGRPWSDRVFGYMYLPAGEGIRLLNIDGWLFDQSPVMQQAFRKWVRARYPDEAALRKAWGDEKVTFDTVAVPTEDAYWAEMRNTYHWLEGNQLCRMRDYMTLQRELFLRWYRAIIRTAREATAGRPTLFGIDMCKQPLMGWQIQLAFRGKGPAASFPNILYTSGSVDVGELLDESGLDVLITPADYTARTVGYGWEPEGIADSLRLRGKTILVENDCRTFVRGEHRSLGAFKTPAEVRAGMLRNAAWSLSRGHIDYWMIAGGDYFDDPKVHEHGVRVVRPLLDAAPNWPHKETEHAIAMIIDDSSPFYEDGSSGYQNLAVLWQRVLGLAHCGIPYRVYLFSDLARPNMPDYRCYLFPNLFKMDDERLALLKRKVFRDGRMAIFGPATGITDGQKLSATWASRLLGVRMRLYKRQSPRRVIVGGAHAIVRAMPASLTYGDSLPYGPILYPSPGAVEKAGADVLGMATTFWRINPPGLFIKDFRKSGGGDYCVAWSVAVPLPAPVLRELARYGGCHVWNEQDDVVLASDTVAALHSVKGGERVLKLPTPRPVWDLLTGKRLGGKMSEIAVQIRPPETRVFYFGEQSPYGQADNGKRHER